MSFPAYAAYGASGVEWIGDIPSGWSVIALKHLVAMKSGEQITVEQIETEGPFPVYGGNGLRGYTTAFTHEGHYALIGRQGALCGNVNYAEGRFWATEHAVVVSPRRPCAVRWLGELLRAMDLRQYSVTAAQPGLSVEVIGNLRVPLPPPTEQSGIAAFLDRETGKIDALVAEQERLIALLKEKRQAVISQAVTKGLDPNAPMKDSGVEWLGKVPAAWEVLRLKQTGSLRGGAGFPHEAQGIEGEELPFYKVADLGLANDGITMGTGQHTISRQMADELRAKVIPAGSILYAKIGAALLLNRRRVTTTECCVDNNMTAFTPDESMLTTRWAWYWLSILDFGKVVNPGAVPSLSEGDQAILPILVPSTDEQRTTTAHLDAEIGRIDALMLEGERAITLLKERRAALISAAVTGKIDVRGLVTPVEAKAKAA